MTRPPPRLRERLRAATRDAHARVDACFPRGLEDQATYRRYLLGMQALVDALEAGLARTPLDPAWAEWRRPQRGDWLADDLRTLGLQPMPDGPALAIADAAEAAGALYVIEGSAMGASQLQRQAAALGFGAGHGALFLDRHGGGDAPGRWRKYVACLDNARFDEQATHRVFDAAARGFACAEAAFLRARQ